ncbi:MAG: glycosyltransferase, partial [Gemmatimonadales bacterium]
MNFAADDVVIGCVAHLVRVKGHPTLLEAVARVPAVRLLIAGKALDEEYAASLERLSRDLGIQDRVVFVGDVADVPAFLSEADIFALPTWEPGEGCPVALL